MTFKVGDDYGVWWNTNRPKVNGYYPAMILEVMPYTGKYPQWFTHVLKVMAPSTRKGWLEITANEYEA